MEIKLSVLILFCSALFFGSCTNKSSEKETETVQTEQPSSLIGKRIIVDYSVIKAEIHYISDSTLHWKTTTPENEVADAKEKMYYQPIADNLFFVNWIEEDGTTISQTVDLKNNVVYAFMSYSDKDRRGERGNVLMTGKLTLVEE